MTQETSIAAYLQIQRVSHSLRGQVWRHIHNTGSVGATDQEIQRALDIGPQTQTARRNELAKAGAIEDSSSRRMTQAGRLAIVWRSVEG